MHPPIDMIGKRFGRLVVVESAGKNAAGRKQWRCRCDCGSISVTFTGNLTSGGTQSCGCLQKDKMRRRMRTHGETETAEHRIWRAMRQRCENHRHKAHKYYGGRGIKVCEAWRASYEAFRTDMGARPSPRHSIDRIDNDGNYEPGNCRWATQSEQIKNQRPRQRKEPAL